MHRWCACIPPSAESFRSLGGVGGNRSIHPGDDRRNFREFPHNSRAALRRHRRQPGPASFRRDRPISARSPPWLRRFEHPRAVASAFYDVRYRVSRDLHAVERNRMLSGLALGYTPRGAPDFGLDRTRFASGTSRYAVLLHATARPEKQWPEGDWIALGKALGGKLELVLPWGTELERARSERIAAQVPGARVPERAPLDQVAKLIAGAAICRRRRYGSVASRRRLERAAGCDFYRHQTEPDRPCWKRAANRSRRRWRAAGGRYGH